MRSELETVLRSIERLSPTELPALLAELELVRATALLRMSTQAPTQATDELVDAKEASRRLGISRISLYRRASRLPFSRRIGKRLLFSSQGIDQYIARRPNLL